MFNTNRINNKSTATVVPDNLHLGMFSTLFGVCFFFKFCLAVGVYVIMVCFRNRVFPFFMFWGPVSACSSLVLVFGCFCLLSCASVIVVVVVLLLVVGCIS